MKRKFLQVMIMTAVLAIFAVESCEIYRKLSRVLKERTDNLAAGRTAFTHSSSILEMREFRRQIPANAKCFYWEHEIPGEGGICRECDSIKMNYQLFPTVVQYSDDELMLHSDIIITQTGMDWMLREKLTQLFAKTGKDIEIERVFVGKRYTVFRTINAGGQ